MPAAFEDRDRSVVLSQSWNGSGTDPGGAQVTISNPGMGTGTVQIVGAMTATVTFEVSDDAATYVPIPATNLGTGMKATTATTAGMYVAGVAGYKFFRARCSAYTNGSPTVTMNVGGGSSDFSGITSGGVGGGGPVSIADGNDIAEGTVADAAVTGDNPGTVNAHLRGITKQLAGTLVVDTELPAAAALSDGTAGPTVPGVGAFGMALNGSTWDPIRNFNPNAADGTVIQNRGLLTGGPLLTYNGATYDKGRSANTAANTTGTGLFGVGPLVWDATNWQRQSQASVVTGTTGTGLLASGPCLWDLVGTTNFVKQAGDGSGRAMVVGAAASGATLAGNPVRVGISDGTLAQDWKQVVASNGQQTVPGYPVVACTLYDGVGMRNWRSGIGDADAGANTASVTSTLWNGTNFDRTRSNVDVTLLTSAARTTTQTSADIVTYNCHSIMVTLDMTVVGTGSVTLTINYKDPASGKYILLLSGVAVTTNITSVYSINPNIPAVANVTAQKDLGRVIQIVVTANNANSATYSVGYSLIN